MANEYFTHDTNRVPQGSRAVANHVNDIADQIEVGLDKLPTEAELKQGKLNYSSDTGIADAYIVTLSYTPTLSAGLAVSFQATNANTGASTLNVNSTGVRPIYTNSGTELVAGQISPGQIIELRYDGSAYRIMATDVPSAGIKAIYEAAPDTNAFTDAFQTKLTGIESSATADQTGAEIKALYEAEADTNALTDTLLTKLNNLVVLTGLNDVPGVTVPTPGTDNVLSWNGSAWIDAPVSSIPGGDAATLDGLDSTQFLRSDATDTLEANLACNAGVTIDGRDISDDGAQLDTNTTKLAGIEAGATADQTITAGTGLSGGGTGNVTINHDSHTGDVTGSTTLTIANDAVTYAKLQNVAANSLLGNNTGSAANAIELTATQVRTFLNVADGATAYTHPTHPGDDINLDTGPMTGGTVISDLDFNVTTDTDGHVTDANATYATRVLTASDVGAVASTGGAYTGDVTSTGQLASIDGTDSNIRVLLEGTGSGVGPYYYGMYIEDDGSFARGYIEREFYTNSNNGYFAIGVKDQAGANTLSIQLNSTTDEFQILNATAAKVGTKEILTKETAETSHTRCGTMQLYDGEQTGYTTKAISSDMASGSFETYGATGDGGANNTWDMLDEAVNAGATGIILAAQCRGDTSSTALAEVFFYAQDPSKSEAGSGANVKATAGLDANASGQTFITTSECIVPMSSDRIKLGWGQVNATSVTVTIYYKGFITD